jgi:hypothetical protein
LFWSALQVGVVKLRRTAYRVLFYLQESVMSLDGDVSPSENGNLASAALLKKFT